MLDNAWIIPALPAISFFLILLMGKRLPRKGSEIGILAVGASFVLSCVALAQWIHKVDTAEKVAPVVHSITWWQNGLVKFSVGTRIDGLSVIVAFVVTFISLLVHVYSTAYMRGDRRYTHFFARDVPFPATSISNQTTGTLAVASADVFNETDRIGVNLHAFRIGIAHYFASR